MRKPILIILLVVFSLTVKAQEIDYSCQKGQYITFGLGGGLQTLKYDLSDYGEKKSGAGFNVNFGYQYFFTTHLGVGSGLGFQSFKSSAILNYVQAIPNAVDEAGEFYVHRTYINDLKEKQNCSQLSIPIGLYYQTNIAQRLKFVAGLGLNFGFVVGDKFSTTSGNIETRAYYPEDNLELFGMTYHNLYTASDFKGNTNYNNSVSGFLDLGIYYSISQRLDVGIDLSSMIGLSKKTESSQLPLYDPDCKDSKAYTKIVYNGALNSSIVDNSREMALSVRIGIRYRFGGNKQNEIPPQNDEEVLSHIDLDTSKQIVDIDTTSLQNQAEELVDTTSLQNRAEELVDNSDKPQEIETPTKESIEQQQKSDIDFINSIRFLYCDFNKTDCKIDDEDLNHLVKILKENPNIKIELIGHTCDIGTMNQNKIVGERRAEAFKSKLVKYGVEPSRITCISKWYSEPLVPNTSETNRAKNRKVEIKVK